MRNTKTKKIEKYECLARIDDDGSLASPIRFMEACRMTGTLSLITRRIVANAFKVFSKTDYEFSINITSNDINLGYLEEFLLLNVEKYNIYPSRVVLELLEDIVTLTESNILEQINSLRKKGFKIALDDFGVENSNFSRL
jgi:EAL domain-containing protein (putative c-di-GMP-specific phosphodiesterase class I)